MIVTKQLKVVNKPFDKKLYVLSNFKIKQTMNFINLHIPTGMLNGRHCVIGFYNKDHLSAIKLDVKHPYSVSEVESDDLFAYCYKQNTDALILHSGFCEIESYQTFFEGTYYTYEHNMSIDNVFMFDKTLD